MVVAKVKIRNRRESMAWVADITNHERRIVLQTQLNVMAVEPFLVEQAVKAFEDGNVAGLLGSCGGSQLAFVADNFPLLRHRGIYEECLLRAFTRARINNHQWQPQVLQILFDYADREKLRAAGQPIPDEPVFRVYRGIAGIRDRHPRGFSWSLSKDVACWYATRLGLQRPGVLVSQVKNEAILAFTDSRNEKEVLCRPAKYQEVKMIVAAMEEGAARHQETMRERYEDRKKRLFARLPTESAESSVVDAGGER